MAPVAAGVKVTLTVHEAEAASDVPQVVAEMAKALALVPVVVSPEMAMAVLSLFFSVAFFAALVSLRPCLPKENVAGVNVACANADEPRTSRESKRRVPHRNTFAPYVAGLEPVGEDKRAREIEARIDISPLKSASGKASQLPDGGRELAGREFGRTGHLGEQNGSAATIGRNPRKNQ